MNDLISIIVPIYNVEKYLHKCIDSIINQTYQNLEIILVDDGSPDKCGEICDEYAKNDSRIKVLHKENGGLSDARNAGIDAAKGEYLAFIDSDDYIALDMIETLHNSISKDKSDLAICDFMYVYEDYNEIEKIKVSSPIKNELISGREALKKLVESKNWYYVIAVSKLYRKKLFENIRFPKGKQHEDEFVVHRIFDKCNRISCIEKPMYFYVQRSFSIMNSTYSVKRLDAAEAYLDRVCYFADKGLSEAAEKTAYTALRFLQYANENLDLKELQNRNRYFELRKQFVKVYFSKLLKKVGLRANLHFSVFCVNADLYFFLKKMYGFIRKARKAGIRGCIGRLLIKPKRVVSELIQIYKVNRKLGKTVRLRKKFDKIAFIIATPSHGNLGDHAIVYAEYGILKKFGYTENIIEISNNEYKKFKKIIKKYICEADLIVIDGGGNLGTLWPHEDDKISEIIDAYKKNKIVVFPQTCYYDDSKEAMLRLNKNREIYKSAKKLLITLRDRKSYEFCCENFKNVEFKFLPDVVLSLRQSSECKRENKCLLCFREDLEKVLTDDNHKYIYDKLSENSISYESISTIYPTPISALERVERLKEVWSKMSGAKLLITDRLHGMIFAAITGTPCLALDNKSKKVSGVFEWISSLDYIKVCEDVEEVTALIPKFINWGSQSYQCNFIQEKFNEINL